MTNNNNVGFLPSPAARKLLQTFPLLQKADQALLYDLCVAIASIMAANTLSIENPLLNEEEPTGEDGCQIIRFGGELFIPIRKLRKDLDSGDLTLLDYFRTLTEIVDDLAQITRENCPLFKVSPGVRNHMKRLTNVVVINLEAGAILNTIFDLVDKNDDDGDDTA